MLTDNEGREGDSGGLVAIGGKMTGLFQEVAGVDNELVQRRRGECLQRYAPRPPQELGSGRYPQQRPSGAVPLGTNALMCPLTVPCSC